MKYDGYRVLLSVGGGGAVAYTRSGLDWSEKFTALVAEPVRRRSIVRADAPKISNFLEAGSWTHARFRIGSLRNEAFVRTRALMAAGRQNCVRDKQAAIFWHPHLIFIGMPPHRRRVGRKAM